MPEYLEDPSVLTKEQLKSELVAHSVELPSGTPNKHVLVQLYLKHVTVQNNLKHVTVQNNKHRAPQLTDGFSSDEEPPALSGRPPGERSSRKSEKIQLEELDVTVLTDEGLRDELLKRGVDVGPIVASTRKLYEKKLQKLLGDGPAQLLQVNHNGNYEADIYSDKEDELTPEPKTVAEPEPALVLERAVRSRGKNSPIISQQQMVEKISARDESLEVGKKDVLKELVPNNAHSPTGLSATCRRPIRGGAELSVTTSDLGTNDNHALPSKPSKTFSSSHTESHMVHRVSSLLPPSSSSFQFPSGSCSPSRLLTASPPAGQSRAVHRSSCPWVKLALLGFLTAFFFLVYQNMAADST